MSRPGPIVVLGGGISGLAAAHRVVELDPAREVVVLEAGDRVGGLIRTERADGFVIEHGPDAILTEKPWALDLAKRLGLEGEIVRTRPERAGAYVVARGRLERIPDGFSLLAPARLRAFLRSPILSPFGKARVLAELALPRRGPTDDESLESFVTRRFGREIFERLAQPMVGGIYGADPRELSLSATMPRFAEMETSHRSLILALRARNRAHVNEVAAGARYGLFVSFKGGTEALVHALAAKLGARVRLRAEVEAVLLRDGGYTVRLADGGALEAASVIVALPAWRAATVVSSVDPALGARLLGIPYGSSAAVTFAWPKTAIEHPLDAYGFVVPLVEQREIMASTWASEKWPGRAPEGQALLRVFVGGAGHEHLVDLPDAELQALARRELEGLMGLRGEPTLVRVDRYKRSIPHYTLGHRARVEAIAERLRARRGLHLAGNAYHGVGVPDAVHAGENAAEDALHGLTG